MTTPHRMAPNLTLRFLIDRSRGLTGWAVGLVAYTTLIISVFPTIRDSDAFGAALEDYPDELKELFGGEAGFDLTTGAGFLGAELYYLVLPLLLAIVAIGYGASLGMEQENGLIDLILANPIRRRRVVLERALAIVVAVVALTAIVGLSVVIVGSIVDLGIGLSELLAASVAVALLGIFHGLVALTASAVFGRRSLAVGIATVAFAAGYLLNVASSLVDWLEPVKSVAPYFQAVGSAPLVSGWALGDLGLLLGESLTLVVLAVLAFDRRDLS